MIESSTDLYRKARELMERNRFEEAVLLFEKSIILDPHFKTLELLGECYIALNLLDKSIIPLAAAVTLNRGVRSAALLANVLLKLKKYNAAIDVAEIALNRDSKNRMALSVLKEIESLQSPHTNLQGEK